ncbi:MAG: META domain-containing protein [Candidatus Pacebacteria bacterium]|nr:META domain-containing protein [Candidatus Paceibacterota bacterium]
MKYKKVYIISAVIAIVIIAVAIFLRSTDKVADNGISELVNTPTSTSTDGVINSLGARDVENKAAYSRIQSDWVWEKTTYSDPSLATVVPSKGKDFILTLNENKKLSVKGDCNVMNGSYSLDENTVSGIETEDEMSLGAIKIGAVASTKKYCEWSKEDAFLKDFSRVSAYNMRTLKLEILLPNNEGVMIFDRKEELEG